MKKITKAEILGLFDHVNGSTFIGLDTLTNVKLTGGKGNELQGRIQKLVVDSNVMVFQNKTTNGYENIVNKRLVAEGKNPVFEVGERTWGKRLPNSPFITHVPKGQIEEKLYLEVIFLPKPKENTKVMYLLDGKPISKDLITGLPEDKEESGQGGISDEGRVIIRTYSIDSIIGLRINKDAYGVE